MSAIEELMAAIVAKDVAAVRALLDREPSLVEAVSARGDRPLLRAIYHDAPAVVALLRERGAEPDLFEAAALGDVARLRALLEAAPDGLAARSHDGWTALHLAAHFGQAAAVRFLLDRGADVAARSANRLANTALHAALAGGDRAVIELLLARGAAVNSRQHGGFTALHAAAQSGRLDLVDLLLAHGADVDIRSDAGQTTLDFALAGGHAAVAERLRQHLAA